VAQVHVDVGKRVSRHGPVTRSVRWADRALLGAVMGFAAFAIERVVLRSSKRKAATAPKML
jgi:hypothetical protein